MMGCGDFFCLLLLGVSLFDVQFFLYALQRAFFLVLREKIFSVKGKNIDLYG